MKANQGIVMAAAALLLAGCAPSAMGGAPGDTPQRESAPSTVTVDNRNWLDVTVYVMQGTSRIRLGMVTGMNSATFRLPRTLAAHPGQVRLLADPVGSNRAYLSDAVQIRPGQRVGLEVGSNLNVSFISVWN
jgi:hypothetical protein